jgi:hypothetical protein
MPAPPRCSPWPPNCLPRSSPGQLGITIRTAVSWQKAASDDWMTYAAAISCR